jgi:2-polyprenyl-3-methyl-5-hydroxy-6-metoxy-1,4-benzoquinol methylase
MGEGGADWRTRLYDSYVSSGQSASLRADSLSLRNYPQFVRTIERAMNGVDTSARVADLGCGFGSLVFCLREMGWTNVEGVDISPEQIELAHRLGVSEVRLGDVAAFLEEREGTLDVVFLMDVLEHLTRQELFDALDGVMRALAPGGRIVTHVPNGAGIFPGRVRWGDLTHEQADRKSVV